MTETKDGYTVRDKRGVPDEEKNEERCRVCGSTTVHTQSYNSPTMDCIKYLRFQASGFEEKFKKADEGLVLVVNSLAWMRDTGCYFEPSADNQWYVVSPAGKVIGKHQHSLSAIGQAMQAFPGPTL